MSTRSLDLGILAIALPALLATAGCGPHDDVRADAPDRGEGHSEFFGTDDFGITVHADPAEFEDLTAVVDAFQAELPDDVVAALEYASDDQLREVLSWTFLQDVVEYAGDDAQEMGVEYTVGLVDVPYDDLIAIMPPEHWGLHLDHYLGGELLPMPGIEGGQYERMVLSALPCDLDLGLVNNDMTKAEIVRVEPGRAQVYWRVYHSDNDTTEADVGSVLFEAHGEGSTKVVFHSAHVIRGLGGLVSLVPSDIWGVEDAMLGAIGDMFADFVSHYRDEIEAEFGREFGDASKESGTVGEGEWHDFGPFTVEAGGTLEAVLSGSGDADLYVRIGDLPDLELYHCRPYLDGSEERCEVEGPGRMYVSVHGYATSSDYTLEIRW